MRLFFGSRGASRDKTCGSQAGIFLFSEVLASRCWHVQEIFDRALPGGEQCVAARIFHGQFVNDLEVVILPRLDNAAADQQLLVGIVVIRYR